MSRTLARIDSTKSDGYEVIEPIIEQKPWREYVAETHRCRLRCPAAHLSHLPLQGAALIWPPSAGHGLQ